MQLLTATRLSAFRGERLVFRDIDFTLDAGGALLLRGANGAGKSSLLRAIAGLTPLAAGSLRWDGADAFEDLPAHARRIAWLGHLDAIKPGLSVFENVPSMAALADVKLAAFAPLPARLLSAGQKRRLALARVVAAKATLWLLDEPTNGLDAASITGAEALFARHLAAGGMIIASTHTALELPDPKTLQL